MVVVAAIGDVVVLILEHRIGDFDGDIDDGLLHPAVVFVIELNAKE